MQEGGEVLPFAPYRFRLNLLCQWIEICRLHLLSYCFSALGFVVFFDGTNLNMVQTGHFGNGSFF